VEWVPWDAVAWMHGCMDAGREGCGEVRWVCVLMWWSVGAARGVGVQRGARDAAACMDVLLAPHGRLTIPAPRRQHRRQRQLLD
jgi:hypothetical protein